MRRTFNVTYYSKDEQGTIYKTTGVVVGDTMTDAIMACMGLKNVVRIGKVEDVTHDKGWK